MTGLSQEAYEGLTPEQLFEEYRKDPKPELKWEIAMRYSGLIRNVALQIRGVYCGFAQLDDIINEGIIVLADAVDKYDPEKGKFDTFVAKRMRGMIIDLARQQDWVPRTVRRRAKDIERATAEIYSEQGRFPSDHEVAEYLNITDAEYQEAMTHASMHSIISLEELFEEYEQYLKGESANSDAYETPEQSLQKNELLEALANAVSSLKKNEQMVLSLYYQKDLKMKDIASVLGVSAPRVSQVHAKAIQKLKILMAHYLEDN